MAEEWRLHAAMRLASSKPAMWPCSHMEPASPPASQPASQPDTQCASQPSQLALKPPCQPTTHVPGQTTDWPAPAGPRPCHHAARPAGRPAGVASRRAKQSDSQPAANQPDTKLQPAGWPAGRLAGQRPQPASQAGLMGWVSRAGQATPGWRWPDRWPVVPNFGCPGTLVKPEKNSIQGGSVLIRELGPETWDHLC